MVALENVYCFGANIEDIINDGRDMQPYKLAVIALVLRHTLGTLALFRRSYR